MGRRQKTEAQRMIDGSKRRPYHHEQPVPVVGEPVKPSHLSPVASAQWDILTDLLRGESRLHVADALQVENAAHLYAIAVRWQLLSDQTPLVVEIDKPVEKGGPVTDVKPHPAHQQARLAWEAYRKACVELGLTQTSRSKAKGSGGQSGREGEQSPLEKLRAKRAALRVVK